MKHLFLNKELSQIAKEKGFKDECLAIYNDGGYMLFNQVKTDRFPQLNSLDFIVEKEDIGAPIFQQILDWLREKYNIYIEINIEFWRNNQYYNILIKTRERLYTYSNVNTYYECLFKAVEESFKLI